MSNVSRRNFLLGSALAAGTLGVGALTGCSAPADNSTSATQWDEETDVVVIGFGGAGAAAAINAADASASVIVLEKAPEEEAGGNTSVSGGSALFVDPAHEKDAFTFFRYQMPHTITDDEIYGLISELTTMEEWVTSHGGDPTISKSKGSMYGVLPGAEALPGVLKVGGTGAGLFKWLKGATENSAGVTIHYKTPASKLIFDPKTKEVFGVTATTEDGKTINIKAKRGVVMALGGFENNSDLKTTYYPPNVDIYPCGSPHNTGDGLAMVMDVGAQLRGFSSIEYGCHCCKPASEEMGVGICMTWTDMESWNNAIMVNDQGKRFVNEAAGTVANRAILRPLHDKSQIPEIAFSMETLRYTNLPLFMVFDETRRAKGPIMTAAAEDSGNHWARLKNWYTWSADNLTEIEKGWVIKANTLDELAQKLNIDAAGLTATVEAYNAACAAASNDEFDRTACLTPIATAPYYATELALSLINTQGGPARDAEHHVLNTKGEPIPRLYSGGEFGSIYTWLYQGAGNLGEAMGGRVAGTNVAAETPLK